MSRRVAGLAFAVLLAACDPNVGPPEPPAPPPVDVQLRQQLDRWGVIPIGPVPRQDPALVALGRALFFDKLLSGNRDVSCATCHHPASHLGDGLSLAVGTGGTGSGTARTPGEGREFVPRNAPSLLNAGLGLFYLFWDGRISGFPGGSFDTPAGSLLPPGLPNVLAAQAMFPVLDRREMRGQPGDTDVFGGPNELAQLGDSQLTAIWQGVMRRVLAFPEYRSLFAAAFPGTPEIQLGFEHAARAIAAFEIEAFTRTQSPFDRYLERDAAALTAEQKRGALLFFGEARCGSCHNGPLLGGGFANVGAPQIGPGTETAAPLDRGRGDVIGVEQYAFFFRVAPLRNVELTAPYMHSGAYPTLEAVVRHYNDVPKALRQYDVTQLQPALRDRYHGDDATVSAVLQTLDFRVRTPLQLTDGQQRELVAFLQSLTDPAARDLAGLAPPRVPSGLPVN
ncbi:MAG TPA: cytochrome c peroxidase [Gemmatimonadales bacterium]|nr:cytochrome c peroxidase [Gemmatimonadales bacterium]